MQFLKIGRTLYNVNTEILGFIFPGKDGKAFLVLNSSTEPMEFTGLIAEALSWFFSIVQEPVKEDGQPFFVFDLIWGFKNRGQLMKLRPPQQDYAPVLIALTEAVRDLQAQVANPPTHIVPLSTGNEYTSPQTTTVAPITIGISSSEPAPAPSVRMPKLNTQKIKAAVLRKGSGPAEFFPGEKRETPGQPTT